MCTDWDRDIEENSQIIKPDCPGSLSETVFPFTGTHLQLSTKELVLRVASKPLQAEGSASIREAGARTYSTQALSIVFQRARQRRTRPRANCSGCSKPSCSYCAHCSAPVMELKKSTCSNNLYKPLPSRSFQLQGGTLVDKPSNSRMPRLKSWQGNCRW